MNVHPLFWFLVFISVGCAVVGLVAIISAQRERPPDRLRNWYIAPATWYQFWLPQSGFLGGLVAVALGLAVLFICVEVATWLLK